MEHPRTLAGRYELDRPLGSGGMGRVFLATDRVLGRSVAVKVLAPHLARDEHAVSRFRREARSAAGLAHPAIVSVYDSGSENGWHYLVMEHVEGRTLGQVLREEGLLLAGRAAEIAAELARALSEAHAAGIVHRDVKPGNVMVTPDGEVKVVDFGIAGAVSSDSATETAAILGTVSYLAPEQVRGRPADPRSDLYALGVVLYEMLTGRPPFVADAPLAVAYKHVEEAPVPPSELNPDVPPALEAVVMRALAKDPQQRYPSAEAVLEDVDRFLEEPEMAPTATVPLAGSSAGQPHDAATPAGGSRPGAHRATRSRRWMVAVAVAAALAAAVPVALVLSSGDEASTKPPEEGAPAPGGDRSTEEGPDGAATPDGGTTKDENDGEEGQEAPSNDGSEPAEEGAGEEPEPSPTPTPTPSPSPTPSEDPSPSPSAPASP
ncbi:MAG: protein kinase domain-containing protein [Actinomycetota bacterium]